MRIAFDMFDKDSNGFLSTTEFLSLLQVIEPHIPDEESKLLNPIIENYLDAKEPRGQISKDEFSELLASLRAKFTRG